VSERAEVTPLCDKCRKSGFKHPGACCVAVALPPPAHPPEGSREPQKWPCRVAQGTQCSSEMCEPPTPPPGPVQDGRHLPTHAVMWLVVNERICRKQHAPTEPHEWERATFSPAPEGE
jgi:hypothetical protein